MPHERRCSNRHRADPDRRRADDQAGKNRLKVQALRGSDRITANAFNVKLLIAVGSGGQWKPASRIHVDAHQPAIFA
jgi:hypothetical protein